MRAELNHRAESRPITAASDPTFPFPLTSFTQAQPQSHAETPGVCSLLIVPTSRLSVELLPQANKVGKG